MEENKEIEIYLKSYIENHFDGSINKRNEDGTPNKFYLGYVFPDWLENINRNLSSNKSYDAETQEKLSTYNRFLLFLSQDIIRLYKGVSGYEKTKNTGYYTRLIIDENKILRRLKSINNYASFVKHYIRNKQFQKANDIKEHCIALLDNCVYNLNDVLTIDIYQSPLKSHFESVKTALESSINFEELKTIKDLETNTVKEAKQGNTESKELYTPKPVYTINQIALKLAYENVTVTQENADELIKSFGHSSGHALYQKFNKVWNSKQRIKDPDKTKKILENKIKLFESVVEILGDEFKEKAESEIKTLKTHLSKY